MYRYIPGKDKLIPFIVKKPAENPDMFLTMGVNTGRYCFMQTIGKEFNFEKGRGFPTTDLMYDSREKVVFKPIVLNADYTTRKRVEDVYKRQDMPLCWRKTDEMFYFVK